MASPSAILNPFRKPADLLYRVVQRVRETETGREVPLEDLGNKIAQPCRDGLQVLCKGGFVQVRGFPVMLLHYVFARFIPSLGNTGIPILPR